MANEEHIKLLKQGVNEWNEWRKLNLNIRPDLSGANLSNTDLKGFNLIGVNFNKANLSGINLDAADIDAADFRGTNLYGVDLCNRNLRGLNFIEANLKEVDLNGADLREANLSDADLFRADLKNAILIGANLNGADLREANLSDADLSHTNLNRCSLVNANLSSAKLVDCSIYGISAWDVQLQGTIQENLNISPIWQNPITVDDLEVAQFIYLLIDNKKIRNLIDTITSKVVLILGRFSETQKPILNALRSKLTNYNYIPVLFDFDVPKNRNISDTVSTLASMARFIIADFSEARIVLQEIERIATLAVPVIPLLKEGENEPNTISDLRQNHRSILKTRRYANKDELIDSIQEKIIGPAEAKIKTFMDKEFDD